MRDHEPDPALDPATMAHAYLEDYVLQQYRTLNTARPRVDHLRKFFGGWGADAITADSIRTYQLWRRNQERQTSCKEVLR